jgi:hypothetical protein
MNYIQVIDDRPIGGFLPVLQVKEDDKADNIVRCLIENGMIVKRQHLRFVGE